MIFIVLNECMAFLTIIIAFPGMMPPTSRIEWFMLLMMLIPMSFVWWLYLAIAPFVFFVLWVCGEFSLREYFDAWPWNLFAAQHSERETWATAAPIIVSPPVVADSSSWTGKIVNRNGAVDVRGWCPVDRKMVDVLVSSHRITLPASEVVIIYWCKECTACIKPEDIRDDDQAAVRLV